MGIVKYNRSDYGFIEELLYGGQYAQAAEVLRKVRTALRPEDEALSHILDAACQICVACGRCHDEQSWHQWADEEARQREQGLRQQLAELLDLLEAHVPAIAMCGNASCSQLTIRRICKWIQGLELWRQFRRLLGRKAMQPCDTPCVLQLIEHNATEPGSIAPESGTLGVAEREDATGALPLSVAPTLTQSAGMDDKVSIPECADVWLNSMVHSLLVYSLGTFRVYNGEQLIERWPGQKCTSVFKYLLFHRDHPIPREILMDLFWRDADPTAARQSLYQAIYRLRQTLRVDDASESGYILCDESCYCLDPAIELWIDCEVFIKHYQAGQQLERASQPQQAVHEYETADQLYGGDFLIQDIYEDWTFTHRENYRHIYLDLLSRLSRYYYEEAEFSRSIAYSQKILAQDSCREDAHRRMMRCYLQQDQRHLALRQYHRCTEALQRELDVAPMPATVELYQQIRQERAQNFDHR